MLKGGGRLKIADISTYQGKVNWDVARKELGYVIFRASIGTKIDDRYIYNANNCGIPFGGISLREGRHCRRGSHRGSLFY